MGLHGFNHEFPISLPRLPHELRPQVAQNAQVASLMGSSVGTLRATVRQLTGGRQCLAQTGIDQNPAVLGEYQNGAVLK